MSYDDINAAIDVLDKAGTSLLAVWAKHFGQPPCAISISGDVANMRATMALIAKMGGIYTVYTDSASSAQRWYVSKMFPVSTMVGVYYDSQKTAQTECDRLNKLTT